MATRAKAKPVSIDRKLVKELQAVLKGKPGRQRNRCDREDRQGTSRREEVGRWSVTLPCSSRMTSRSMRPLRDRPSPDTALQSSIGSSLAKR